MNELNNKNNSRSAQTYNQSISSSDRYDHSDSDELSAGPNTTISVGSIIILDNICINGEVLFDDSYIVLQRGKVNSNLFTNNKKLHAFNTLLQSNHIAPSSYNIHTDAPIELNAIIKYIKSSTGTQYLLKPRHIAQRIRNEYDVFHNISQSIHKSTILQSNNQLNNNPSASLIHTVLYGPVHPYENPRLIQSIAMIYPDNGGTPLKYYVQQCKCRLYETSIQKNERRQPPIIHHNSFSDDENDHTAVGEDIHSDSNVADHTSADESDDTTSSADTLTTDTAVQRLDTVIDIIVSLCDVLTYLHDANLRYSNLCTPAILYNAHDTNSNTRIQLLNYSALSIIAHDRLSYTDSNKLLSHYFLPYCSPEQTGRMNCSIDHRADLYSLGCTIYELVCGQTPFVVEHSDDDNDYTAMNNNNHSNHLQANFSPDDTASIIHAHLAKIPSKLLSLRVVDSTSDHPVHTVLKHVSEIIMKLLAKQPVDRYQSTRGLRSDLLYLRKLLHTNKSLSSDTTRYDQFSAITGPIEKQFIIGKTDIDSTFRVSTKLYGRQNEVNILLAAFDRVSGSNGLTYNNNYSAIPSRRTPQLIATGLPELILLGGVSGIGKTSLVNEIHKPITRARGILIRGKFDLYQRHVSCLLQAFQSLVTQLLSQSSHRIAYWREQVLAAVGVTGQCIVDVLPQLEKLIGKQQKLNYVSASEAQNRFDRTFIAFVSVFAKPEHPLVVFIDDTQWADSMSLQLVKLLFNQTNFYLLIIAAYRNNEVTATHPLTQTINELQLQQSQSMNTINHTTVNVQRIQTIELGPLDKTDYISLLRDTFRNSPDISITQLADCIYTKTSGNIFFANSLLSTYVQNKLLKYDYNKQYWVWSIQDLLQANMHMSSDVVDILCAQITRLSTDTQSILQLASCIGNTFTLNTLAVLTNTTVKHVASQLWPAVAAGLLIPLGHSIDVFVMATDDDESDDHTSQLSRAPSLSSVRHSSEDSNSTTSTGHNSSDSNQDSVTLKFSHDRVQQASKSLIPDNEREQTHLKIGRILLKHQLTQPQPMNDVVLGDILSQFSVGYKLITDPHEALQLIELNYNAACTNKQATAYDIAVRYLNICIELLSVVGDTNYVWTHHYKLTIDVYRDTLDLSFLTGNTQLFNELIDDVLSRATTALDKVSLYEIYINYVAQSSELERGEYLTEQALQVLQIDLKSAQPELDLDYIRRVASTLPIMTNQTYIVAIRLLATVAPIFFGSGQVSLYRSLGLTIVNMILKHGMNPLITFALQIVATTTWYQGDYNLCYRTGKLGIDIFHELPAELTRPCLAKTYVLFYYLINHWGQPLAESVPKLLEAVNVGMSMGDLGMYTGNVLYNISYILYTNVLLYTL